MWTTTIVVVVVLLENTSSCNLDMLCNIWPAVTKFENNTRLVKRQSSKAETSGCCNGSFVSVRQLKLGVEMNEGNDDKWASRDSRFGSTSQNKNNDQDRFCVTTLWNYQPSFHFSCFYTASCIQQLPQCTWVTQLGITSQGSHLDNMPIQNWLVQLLILTIIINSWHCLWSTTKGLTHILTNQTILHQTHYEKTNERCVYNKCICCCCYCCCLWCYNYKINNYFINLFVIINFIRRACLTFFSTFGRLLWK